MGVSYNQKIYYTLRIACAMCFIGHGAFGIITKPIWANYFGVFGIDHATSWHLMPVVGFIDILMGIVILLYPLRSIVAWLVFWGILTALLRPLSGEPFAEFIERAGNYGAPLALLIFAGADRGRMLLKPLQVKSKRDIRTLVSLSITLRIVVFLLFLGHGWLNIIEKQGLLDQYGKFGFSDPATIAHLVGSFEIVAAFVVLIRPFHSFILFLFFWKVASELFYPHYELFEWIERGGSYGSILALWFTMKFISVTQIEYGEKLSCKKLFLFNPARLKFFRSAMQKISLK